MITLGLWVLEKEASDLKWLAHCVLSNGVPAISVTSLAMLTLIPWPDLVNQVFPWKPYFSFLWNQPSQSYGFPSSHVWMRKLDYKESWTLKNWCFWTMVLEKTLESPLDYKEMQPVHPKGNQSWIFIGRTDAEAETPILWPPDGKNWLIGKDPNAGKDWRWEEKGTKTDGWMDVSLSRLSELVMDRKAWRATVHGVTKCWTQLSNWTDGETCMARK